MNEMNAFHYVITRFALPLPGAPYMVIETFHLCHLGLFMTNIYIYIYSIQPLLVVPH